MKKTIGIVAASAFAIAALSAPVAAVDQKDFGQLHKSINTAGAVAGVDNVGQLLQDLRESGVNPGQAKKGFQAER